MEHNPIYSQIPVGGLGRQFIFTVFVCLIFTSLMTTNAELQEKSSLLKILTMGESKSQQSVKIIPQVNDAGDKSMLTRMKKAADLEMANAKVKFFPARKSLTPGVLEEVFPRGPMGPVKSIDSEKSKAKGWLIGPDGPILVGPSGNIGPSGLVGPSGSIHFSRFGLKGPMEPVKSIDPEKSKAKGWLIGPDGPILVGPSGNIGPSGLVGPSGSIHFSRVGLKGPMGPVKSIDPEKSKAKGWLIGPDGPILVGPSGNIGPSGLVGPSGSIHFSRFGLKGPMGPVKSIDPEKSKAKGWLIGPDGPILVGPSGNIGPSGLVGPSGSIHFSRVGLKGPMGPVKSIDPARSKEKGWVIGPDGPILVGPSGQVGPGGVVLPFGPIRPVKSIDPARSKEKAWLIGPNGSSGSIGSSGLVGPGGGPVHFSRVEQKGPIWPIGTGGLTQESNVPE